MNDNKKSNQAKMLSDFSTFLDFVDNEKSEVETRKTMLVLSVNNWFVKAEIVLKETVNWFIMQ